MGKEQLPVPIYRSNWMSMLCFVYLPFKLDGHALLCPSYGLKLDGHALLCPSYGLFGRSIGVMVR
jgi:hypothetical protein